ncbi:MAG: acyltransferase family protein [Dissulfurispiraceae bacterium]
MNPIIELFRAVGAWMVLNTHYARFLCQDRCILNFFWTGVYLFFVISGFVFAPTILSKDTNLTSFAVKRFFRIYPLYLFSLILYYFVVQHDPRELLFFIKHLFFLQTTTSKTEALYFNAAYWSLPPEVEFYISIPLLGMLRKKYGVKSLLILLPVTLGLKFLLALGAKGSSSFNVYKILGFHLPGTAPEFAVGIVLYSLYEYFSKKNIGLLATLVPLVAGVSLLTALGIFFVAHGDNGIENHLVLTAFFSTLCAIGFALVLFSLLVIFHEKKIAFSSLFIAVGSISYGVYLFHNFFLLVFDKTGLALSGLSAYLILSISVGIFSFISFMLIENPLRSFGKKLASHLSSKKSY